ncbi:aminotransferase class I/II-fold pyridoxal phosphate-dependent enzyme [Actinoplanes sp. HUAS TT8]|uniref:aminotransferase class I/II-fold pyridoxal phosphate-dependent enzyme n=1 Tax=Actinoplanes sp. HUAS TT8 TaxID=3447453 RepID=UPI003F51E48D
MAEQYQVSGDTAAEISASIEAGVVRGDWIFGAALPPVRVLAGALHVSPATVAKAYQELRQRGVVETEGRRGTRIRARPPVEVSRSALRLAVPENVLDLSSGEPDLRLLPPLGPALRAVAEHVGPPQGYTSAVTMPELIEAARARLSEEGIPVDGAAIAVTAGTLDSIERLLIAHLRPGDAVAVEDPGWANLLDLVAALGMRTVPVAMDEEGPEPESLAAALRAGARAVVITVRAQNPTGAVVSAARATSMRELFAEHPEVLLVEDDHAAELAVEPAQVVGPVTRRWAFVRSASKPFGPDLRIAVLAGDEASVARVAGRMRIGMGWVSTLSQRLLLQLWRDEAVTALIKEAARSYGVRRTTLIDMLRVQGVAASGAAGINVWVPVPDETHAVAALRDSGYAVAPGARFRISSPPGVRITVSPLDELDLPALAQAVVAAVRPAVGIVMR